MGKIRSKGTAPERQVAEILRGLRYRFVMHDIKLPGTPDFVLVHRKLVIFVHGCFWHCHNCRRGRSQPATRADFWDRKRAMNVQRDRRATRALRQLGYSVLILWECRLWDTDAIKSRIRAQLQK